MSTIYTLNGKVLKNAANDKWLTKKEELAGFIMDASNVVSTATGDKTFWESPTYPDAWNGGGKTVNLIVSEDITTPYSSFGITYASRTDGQEELFGLADYIPVTNNTLLAGTYTYTATENYSANMSHGYGKYICLTGINTSDISKITIQIPNP